ncbi:MAG: ribonuclease HII [Pseudomonadota bacterium]
MIDRQQEVGNHGFIAGVDEAGRGPLAGPVVAAAVILDAPLDGLADSKKLTEKRRDELAVTIRKRSLAWAVAWADVAEIDHLNILNATMLSMRRAILGLRVRPNHVLVDGNRLPGLEFHSFSVGGDAIIKGDDTEPAISAASILAKTVRDGMMRELHTLFPAYGFDGHKGYGTAAHRACIESSGPCPQHRMSFAPMSSMRNHVA